LPAVDWVLGQYANKNDLSTAIGKRNFSTAGLKLVQNLSDPVEKEHYLDEISNKIGSSRQALLAKFIDEKPAPRPKKQAKIDKSAPNNFANEFGYEDDLLALALIFADSSQYIKNLDQNSLNSDEKNQILRVLQQNQREELKKNENYVKILLLKADERYDGWKNKEVINEIKRLVQKVKIQNITKQKEDLQDQLKDAEIQGEDGLARDILLKITELNKEINSGKN
jgi:DNA primase